MKKRSIQTKFLITIIAAILAVVVFIGGIGIVEIKLIANSFAEKLVETTCAKESARINDVFGDMEKSVKIMESYLMEITESEEAIKNKVTREEIIESSEKMFAEVAKNTEGAVAYYFRFDPEISDNVTGLFYSKQKDRQTFIKLPPTDLSKYDKEDTEHVGWFWEPYYAREPVWMEPYYNQNSDILMISYVIPMYKFGRFIGIVGMDFDYTVLTSRVNEIRVFENGFAHLEKDGKILYHKELEAGSGVPDLSNEYMQVERELGNGMTLVLSESYDDISKIRHGIYWEFAISITLLVVLFSLVVVIIVRRLVAPLKKLTESAEKLSEENYDIEILHTDIQEIELLSTAFEKMAMKLKEHSRLQYLLAYRDSLTGLRNTTSYKAWISDFDKEIKEKEITMSVLVLDINYLKETNDKYGHDTGNKLIISASQIISGVFKRSPVFRIGGDEFLVILQGRDLADKDDLLKKFREECLNEFLETGNEKIPVSIACGMAVFEKDKDKCFADVFNRADDEMYKNKRKMKGLA